MPDQQSPGSFIQNSLAGGEVSPNLYGRTDLAKQHQSALVMKNFFVDYRGGASTRPGTQYIGQPGSLGAVRLWPFKFSAAVGQTYMLVFSATKLRFIKNPGTPAYPNSSNAGFIISGGSPYELTTPYLAADMPFLKFSQVGDQLTITRRGYQPRTLTRITDTNWTLTTVDFSSFAIGAPTINSISISGLPSGSTDPQKTRYMYQVTAVDTDGNEGPPSRYLLSSAGIDIGATQGTVTVFFSPVASAQYYKVYKALPAPGDKLPALGEQFGFCGYCYGTVFTDSNIVPDFSRAPPSRGDPFTSGQVVGYSISASSNDWPASGTTLSLSGGGSPTRAAVLYPIIDNNDPAGSGHISGIFIFDPGAGYSSAPTVTAAGGGTSFTATLTLSPSTGSNDPDVVGLFQQRQIYASTDNKPNTIFGSRPGRYTDFRKTNPTVDNDEYEFTIATQQINTIVWVQSMPGGLVIGTDSGVVQLTGGSASASNPLAVTPTSAVIVPQSYYGAADVHPLVIDYDILYVQSEGSVVRDLQYNFFVNIYTGVDATSFSSQLFYPNTIVDWAYQDSPNKIIWAVRNDGVLLSLTYLKNQEILGWARHETDGLVDAVAVVQEGSIDAVYLSINRGGVHYIERLADRVYYQIDDAWCLDAALSITSTYPAANLILSGQSGSITITADAPVFAGGDVGKVIRAVRSKATITAYINSTHVTALVDPNYTFGNQLLIANGWRMDPVVSTVSGLSHLNGYTVYALADGAFQGPFVVSAGSINLTAPASQVVVGLPYQCQCQPIMFDPGGEMTVQGRRKKFTAVTLRVKDTARLRYGRDFDNVTEFVQGLSSTDPLQDLPNRSPGLFLGDQRIVLDQVFDVLGTMAIQQDLPFPATILAVIPEVAQGDTR